MGWTTSERKRHVRAERFGQGRTETFDALQLVDRAERPERVTVGDDASREHGANAREAFDLLDRCTVHVDKARRRRSRPRGVAGSNSTRLPPPPAPLRRVPANGVDGSDLAVQRCVRCGVGRCGISHGAVGTHTGAQ
jgi:hypothetical protein